MIGQGQRDFGPLLLALLLGTLYVNTLLPGVGYSGDTAKFQFVGRVLGTPHTTGYPLYVILNHVFGRLVPIGSLAYRANLLSAVFMVLTSIVAYRIIVSLQCRRVAAFAASATFGLTATTWSQSIVAEVYSLHALFVAGIVWLLIEWERSRRSHFFYAAAAVFGLSIGHHMTIATLVPAIVYMVWATHRRAFVEWRKISWILAVMTIGLLQYLYIFWRYKAGGTYLEMEVPDLKTFLWYMTGAQFRGQIFNFSLGEVLGERLPMFLQLWLEEYSFLLPFAALGLWRPGMTRARVFLVLAFLGNVFYALNFDILDVDVYFIPSYLITAILAARGIQTVLEWSAVRFMMISAVCVVAIPAFFASLNYRRVDQSRNTLAAELTESILNTVGRDALIVSAGYELSEYLWYYLLAEGRQERSNVYVLNRFSAEAIDAYIRRGTPLLIPPQRGAAPAGLKVYCLLEDHCRLLTEEGLECVPVPTRPGLWEVSARR